MKRIWLLALLAMVSFSAAAQVAPFGQVIGQATQESVRAAISQRTHVETGARDELTGVPMLIASGSGLGIAGLDKVGFIFNEQNVLVAAMLMLPKSRYADLVASLKSKYPLIDSEEPFVGNRRAEFRAGDVTVTALARHLSHNMTVFYHTQTYYQRYAALKRQQEKAKMARQQSQL